MDFNFNPRNSLQKMIRLNYSIQLMKWLNQIHQWKYIKNILMSDFQYAEKIPPGEG